MAKAGHQTALKNAKRDRENNPWADAKKRYSIGADEVVLCMDVWKTVYADKELNYSTSSRGDGKFNKPGRIPRRAW